MSWENHKDPAYNTAAYRRARDACLKRARWRGQLMRGLRRAAIPVAYRTLAWLNLIAWTAYLGGYRPPVSLVHVAAPGGRGDVIITTPTETGP